MYGIEGEAMNDRASQIPVLDYGYVRLVSASEDADLAVVNAARASFGKDSKELSEKDIKLIKYLAEHGHTSPFRHAFFTFEVKAPLLVARQWWKYVVGSDHAMDSWNEQSRRYVREDPDFYIPNADEWRLAPKSNIKQGSGGRVPVKLGDWLAHEMRLQVNEGVEAYEKAIDSGVAPEQARLFLPAYAMYTTWRWSCSLQSLALFLRQRLGEDAQAEIQEYAMAVKDLAEPHAPHSLRALTLAGDASGEASGARSSPSG